MKKKLTSKFRITVGLVSLLVSLILIAVILKIVPEQDRLRREARTQFAEAITIVESDQLTRRGYRALERKLTTLVDRSPELLSLAVRRHDGRAEITVGEHGNWMDMQDSVFSDTQIRMPIYSGKNNWGNLELRFRPIKQPWWVAIADIPVQMILFLATGGFLVFYLFLGKSLDQLDPSTAIPPRVKNALDTLAQGLFVIDLKGRIVLSNQALATIADATPEEMIGRSIMDLPWSDDNHTNLTLPDTPWQGCISDGQPRRDVIVHFGQVDQNDKGRKTFLVNCTPVLGSNHSHGGVLVSLDDITQLEENKVQLREAKEAAVAANEAKSSFLANMSHEIRTPMNAILGFTDVLRRNIEKNPTKQRQHLNTIHSSGRHLLNLINDILDLSKVESGRMQIELLPTKVHQIVAEVVKVLSVKAAEKGIALNYNFSGQMPDLIGTDPVRLRQILTNLIGNSIKFTSEGGVDVTTEFIVIRAIPLIRFHVRDTGIGMSQEQADKIFDPFTQADASVSRRFGGTGLGLTITKRLAEALGGTIEVSSVEGQGSVFTVSVLANPIDGARMISADQAQFDEHSEGDAEIRWQLPGIRVLLVDDGAENRALMSVLLDEIGAEYETATNGVEAIDAAHSDDWDVILMDMQMPIMDGYTATSQLRQEGYQRPIIALTAHASNTARDQCLAAGCSGFLTKPVDFDQLVIALGESVGVNPEKCTIERDTTMQPEPAKPGQNQPADKPAEVADALIPSSLPIHKQRFREIVEEFLVTIQTRFGEIEEAFRKQDFKDLRELAHWLKGSGPNCGFHELGEPAKGLEDAAKSQNVEQAASMIVELKSIIPRLVVDLKSAPGAVNAPVGRIQTSSPRVDELENPDRTASNSNPAPSTLFDYEQQPTRQ